MSEASLIKTSHAVYEIRCLEKISPEELFENLVNATVFSLQIGIDQIPSIDEDILEFIFSEDYAL